MLCLFFGTGVIISPQKRYSSTSKKLDIPVKENIWFCNWQQLRVNVGIRRDIKEEDIPRLVFITQLYLLLNTQKEFSQLSSGDFSEKEVKQINTDKVLITVIEVIILNNSTCTNLFFKVHSTHLMGPYVSKKVWFTISKYDINDSLFPYEIDNIKKFFRGHGTWVCCRHVYL